MKKILMILTLLFAGIAASGQQYTGRKVTAIDSVVTDTIRARTQAGVWIQGLQFDPAGNNTEIQFNDNGVFGASSNLTWDGDTLQVDNIKIEGVNLFSAVGSIGVNSKGAGSVILDTDGASYQFTTTGLITGGITTIDATGGTIGFNGDALNNIGSLTVDNLTLDGNDITNSTGSIDLNSGASSVNISGGGGLQVGIIKSQSGTDLLLYSGSTNLVKVDDSLSVDGNLRMNGYSITQVDTLYSSTIDVTGNATFSGNVEVYNTGATSSLTINSDSNRNARIFFDDAGTTTWNIGLSDLDTSFNVYNNLTSSNALKINSDNSSQFFEDATFSGTVDINASKSNTLQVNHSGGTLPTPSAGTVATFAKNNSVGSFAQISVISGSSGSASIEFGDVDDANIGRVQYDNASNSLKLQSNNAVGLTIDNAQNATFSGDVGLNNNQVISFKDTGNTVREVLKKDASNDTYLYTNLNNDIHFAENGGNTFLTLIGSDNSATFSGNVTTGGNITLDKTSANNAELFLLNNGVGYDAIYFGDNADNAEAFIRYDAANPKLELRGGNTGGANLTIEDGGNATFSGDVSLTNVLNSATSALRLSGGSTTTTGGSIQLNHNASATPSDIIFRIEGNEVGRYDSSQTRWEFDDVAISGSLSKGSGTFKITHPLDTGKWLYHSFVEAPRADNIYRGQVELYRGIARVRIDTASNMMAGTFEALNQNVQVFVTNNDTWDRVRGYYSNGIIYIECQNELSRAVVDWLVIGERKDQTVIDWNLTDENGRLIPEWNKDND